MTEVGECVNCKYCDWHRDDTWCTKKDGGHYGDTHYHIADTYCDKWVPCEEYKRELAEAKERGKLSYDNGLIPNAWSKWKERK